MNMICVTSVGLSQEEKSPFWMAQWSMSDGRRVKKSTKVPVAGGVFRGEKLTRAQAKNRALLVAQELANAAAVEAQRVDNMSVRELFDKMLGGKLGRVSVATMLQAAGVSQGLAMELVGHDSAEVHAVYIRPNAEQLRQAVAALPLL